MTSLPFCPSMPVPFASCAPRDSAVRSSQEFTRRFRMLSSSRAWARHPVTQRRFSRLDDRPINIMPSAPPQPVTPYGVFLSLGRCNRAPPLRRFPPSPSLLSGSRLGNLARPVMRTAAGLHADATRASLAKNANTSLRFWWVMKARGTRPATVARGSGRRCPASRDRRSRLRLRPSRM
jgi:hypothetical protein